jgi:hypothetical protein
VVEALGVALGADVARMAGGPIWRPPADDERPPVPAAAFDCADCQQGIAP